MILTEGLVLQEEKYWKEFLNREIIPENNSCELYFEEPDIEGFVEKMEEYYPEVRYVNRLMTHSWGQKVIRFYDPDGNLIEVGTPIKKWDIKVSKKGREGWSSRPFLFHILCLWSTSAIMLTALSICSSVCVAMRLVRRRHSFGAVAGGKDGFT
jgi:hypothetical protein